MLINSKYEYRCQEFHQKVQGKWKSRESEKEEKNRSCKQILILYGWARFEIYRIYEMLICLSNMGSTFHSIFNTHKIIPTFKCIAKQYQYYDCYNRIRITIHNRQTQFHAIICYIFKYNNLVCRNSLDINAWTQFQNKNENKNIFGHE